MQEPTLLAEAFSRHRFGEVVAALDDDVTWTLVGGEVVQGRSAVVQLCERSARELSDVTTTWDSFRVVDAGATVVVESWATYTATDGDVSRVASCDIYDFFDGRIGSITSFTVEVRTTPRDG